MRTHTVVSQALDALTHLNHRGAASADPLTGDGVGVLTQIPHLFFRRKLEARGIAVARDTDVAVGMLFLPGKGAGVHPDTAARMVDVVEATAREAGLDVLLWRRVPVGEYALGADAKATLPDIRQVILRRPARLQQAAAPGAPAGADYTPESDAAFERLLYLVRKRLERRLGAMDNGFGGGPGSAPVYIPSLSHRTLSYKGLVVAPNLRKLYPDLNDSDYHTAIALFHQRYSTNTFPMWFTAQVGRGGEWVMGGGGGTRLVDTTYHPFPCGCSLSACLRTTARSTRVSRGRAGERLGAAPLLSSSTCAAAALLLPLAVPGNLNWMRMREETLSSPLFTEAEFRDLLPVVQEGGSDSAALDNVLELMVMCGRDPLAAMALLVPEAYEGNKLLASQQRAFYDYNRTLMEPWDGPAALTFTDGRLACAALDRNGLRPLRYWVTESGKVVAASEVGVVDIPNERVLERGRLGPGDMLAVDTEAGRVLLNDEIKEELAGRRPYQAWLERSVQHVGSGRQGLGQIMSFGTVVDVLTPLTAAATATPEAPAPPAAAAALEARVRLKKAFGYSKEDEELVLRPMMDTAHEPIGSSE